jgi:TRAP-type C4-dicarboxylate transport system substrate-binding protein
VPISVSQAEIFGAAERGVIDGTIATLGMMDNYGLTGVCKYALGLPLGLNVGMINLNENTWITLPEDVKTVVEQAALIQFCTAV